MCVSQQVLRAAFDLTSRLYSAFLKLCQLPCWDVSTRALNWLCCRSWFATAAIFSRSSRQSTRGELVYQLERFSSLVVMSQTPKTSLLSADCPCLADSLVCTTRYLRGALKRVHTWRYPCGASDTREKRQRNRENTRSAIGNFDHHGPNENQQSVCLEHSPGVPTVSLFLVNLERSTFEAVSRSLELCMSRA